MLPKREGRILGFVAINGDELTKLFIARDARGKRPSPSGSWSMASG